MPPDTRWRIGHLGVLATVAAYTDGEGWLDGLLATLDHRRTLLAGLLRGPAADDQVAAARGHLPGLAGLLGLGPDDQARERFLAGAGSPLSRAAVRRRGRRIRPAQLRHQRRHPRSGHRADGRVGALTPDRVTPDARYSRLNEEDGADMDRHHWSAHISRLDPGRDYEQIYRILVSHEFPWDMNQSLSFALYRTYAVPSIGQLLGQTGEFTRRTQKRYDDTALILDTILEHGLASARPGRVRRMNQMHGAYAISNDDKLYVLSTFVVTPVRWLDRYGWRRSAEAERAASANYYRALHAHGHQGHPGNSRDFAGFLDRYEREHFAFSPGGLAVADATLELLARFSPNRFAPRPAVNWFAYALMDDPLLAAFRSRRPSRWERGLAARRCACRPRNRLLPPRAEPLFARQLRTSAATRRL